MGKADEGSSGYLKGNLRQSGDLNLSYPDPLDLPYLTSVARGDIDAEPDIFSFRLPGKQGKFFFDGTDNFNIKFIPYSPVQIESFFSGTNKVFFRVKDEKGFTYKFGEGIIESVQTITGGGSNGPSTSAWLLESIHSPYFNNFIEYKYFPPTQLSYSENIHIISVSDNIISYQGSPAYSYLSPYLIFSTLSNSFLERKPKEIIFKNGKIVFELSSTNREDLPMRSLKGIKIYSTTKTGEWDLIKYIEFNYGYYNNINSKKRLRLDSINIRSHENKDIETYRFFYNSLPLPDYTSTSQDYWGYYNGKNNNNLIPRQKINVRTGINSTGTGTNIWIGSNVSNGREPVEHFMKAGILEQIIYPTGGFSVFGYEPNRYINSNGETKLAGGLRVKSISTHSGPNDTIPLVKIYEYNAARPNFHMAHYVYSTVQNYEYYRPAGGGPAGIAASKRVRNFISNPTIDILPFDGNPVSYPVVTEYLKNGNMYNGKIQYEFQDQGDAQTHSAVSFATGKPSYISKFYARGQLSSKKVFKYDPTSETFDLVKQNDFRYSAFPASQY